MLIRFKKIKQIENLKRAVYLTLVLQSITLYVTYINIFNENVKKLQKNYETNLISQIHLVKSKFTFNSLTDYDDLRMLNKLIKNTINILDRNDLIYWIIGGTLLGAVREKGLVQWDDDADLCLMQSNYKRFLELEPQFKRENISFLNYNKWGFIKLIDSNGKNFTNSDYIKTKYPFIDIFFFRQYKQHLNQQLIRYDKNKIKFSKKNIFKKNIFYANHVFPLKKYQFEDYEISGPNYPYEYLNRVYPGWRKHAKISRHFKKENQNNEKFTIHYDYTKKPYMWIYDASNKYVRTIENYHFNYSNSFEIVIINNKNILNYLPELSPIYIRLNTAKFDRELFMIFLLYKYGGIFMDSSVFIQSDMKVVMDKLKRNYIVGFGCDINEVVCYGRPSTILILASRPKNILIENITKRIFTKLEEYLIQNEMPLKIIIWQELDKLIKLYNYEYYHYFKTSYKKVDFNKYIITIYDEYGSEILNIH